MITVDCSPVIKALALLWILLPLAAMFVPPLSGRGTLVVVVQQTRISYVFMGAIGGSWMLLGLGLVPFLGVHGSSLGKALLMAVGYSAIVGLGWGPAFVELRWGPPTSAVGEPVEFVPTGWVGHATEVRPASGGATDARFWFPKEEWNPAYARAGNKPVKGRVYMGGRDLWFAKLDAQENGGPDSIPVPPASTR
jgi:hypothetical protein